MPLYDPSPMPSFKDANELGVYLRDELEQIAALFAVGQFQSIRFDQLDEFSDLPRPRDGDLAYFTENAAGVNQQGLYEWDQQTLAWKKL